MTANDIKSTPKKAEDALADLQQYAQDAAAARLGQMHAHLVLMPKASGHDGTAAQVHDYYARALAPIVEALRAQAEAGAGLREAAQAIWDDAEQMPGQLRDRPDYVMHIRCDLLCRLRDALAQAGGES